MPRGQTSQKVGSLSVDVIANLGQFDQALDKVEKRLGKANKDVHVRIGVTEAQLQRLQRAYDLIEKIQATGINKEMAGLFAGAPLPRGGVGAANVRGRVNLAIDEQKVGDALRKAAVAAFSQPIENVKLQLDMDYIQQQLQGLPITLGEISHTGEVSGAGTAQRGGFSQAYLKEISNLNAEQKRVTSDLVAALRPALKLLGQGNLGDLPGAAEQINMLATRFFGPGRDLPGMVQVQQVGSNELDLEVIGGALKHVIDQVPEDMASALDTAGVAFQRVMRLSSVWGPWRDMTPAGSAQQQAGAGARTQQQTQQTAANMKAAAEQLSAIRDDQAARDAKTQAAPKTETAQGAPKTPEKPRPGMRIEDLDQLIRSRAEARREVPRGTVAGQAEALRQAGGGPVNISTAGLAAILATAPGSTQRARAIQKVTGVRVPAPVRGIPQPENMPTPEEWLAAGAEQRADILMRMPLSEPLTGRRTQRGRRRRTINLPIFRRPWDEPGREYALGQAGYGAQGVTAYGGTEYDDLFEAAGPGLRALEGWAEVLTPNMAGRLTGTGELVSLQQGEIDYLKGETMQRGKAAGRPMVGLLSPRDALQRILRLRGESPTEARKIAAWAFEEGGPLFARELGPQGASPQGEMQQVSTVASGGGGSVANEARDVARIRDLSYRQVRDRDRIAGLQTQLGRAFDENNEKEVKRLNRAISRVQGRMNERGREMSGLIAWEAGFVTGAANRERIRLGMEGKVQSDDLGEDPLSRRAGQAGPTLMGGFLGQHTTRMADRSAIVKALQRIGEFGMGTETLPEMWDLAVKGGLLPPIVGGQLPEGTELPEIPSVGQLTGMLTQSGVLWNAMRADVLEEAQERGVSLSKRARGKAAAGPAAEAFQYSAAFEKKGDPLLAAGIQAIIGTASSRRGMAEAAVQAHPQPSGMTEARLTGAPTEFRGTVAPGETLARGEQPGGRWTGSIMPGAIFPRQSDIDVIENKLRNMFGGQAVFEHDPLAPGVVPGWWERLGVLGEKGAQGKHPLRLAGTDIGEDPNAEIDRIRRRHQEQQARRLGLVFEGGKATTPRTMAPEQARPLMEQYGQSVEEAFAADPRVQEIGKLGPDLQRRLRVLRYLKQRWQRTGPQGPYRRDPNAVPEVMGGDETARRMYEAGALPTPGLGVPVTEEDIKAGKIAQGPSAGLPLISVAGGRFVPPGEPPEGPPSGGGKDRMRPYSGGAVPVYITGPFPLSVSIPGGVKTTGITRGRAAATEEAAAQPVTQAAPPERTPVQVMRDIQRAVRGEQLLLAATAGPSGGVSAGAQRTQAGPIPYGSDWMRPPGAPRPERTLGPDPVRFIGNIPGGAPPEIVPQREAERSSEQLIRERVSQARAPTPAQLAAALAGVGMQPEEIAEAVAVPRRPRAQPPDIESLIQARQRAREAAAQLPQRALGTTMVQLFQNALGGRQEPTQRLLRFQREAAQVQRMAGGLTSLDDQRRAAGGAYARDLLTQARLRGQGAPIPPELTRSIEANKAQFNAHTESMKKLRVRVGEAGEALKELELTRPADILRNLGAGFIGGIAGGLVTQGVGLAIAGVEALGGIAMKVLDPMIEAAIGYQNVTNQQVQALGEATRANHGLAEETVTAQAAMRGISAATYNVIGPQLEQAAAVEAGNQAYADYIAMIRAGERVGSEMTPRGVFRPTGGVNLFGVQTDLFAPTGSAIQNFVNQFKQPSAGTQGELNRFLTPGLGLPGVGGLPNLGPTQQELSAVTEHNTLALDEVNQQLRKVGSTAQFAFGPPQGPEAVATRAELEAQLKAAGVNDIEIGRMRGTFEALGIQLEGVPIEEFSSAIQQWISALSRPDPEQWLRSMTAPAGALTGQLWQQGMMADLQRRMSYAQFGLQRQISPPVPYGASIAGIAGIPASWRAAFNQGQPSADRASMFLDQFTTIGQDLLQQQIGNIPGSYTPQGLYVPPEQNQAQAQGWLDTATEAGAEITRLTQMANQIQIGQQVRMFNQELKVSTRTMEDLVGLSGQHVMIMSDGTEIEASRMGIMQRENMITSRNLQLLGFERQERQINYRVALAGFMAEGATGEERAARIRIAEKEAALDREMLEGTRDIADNDWLIQQEQISRNVEDAAFSWENLVQTMAETGKLRAIDEQLQKWQAVRDFAAGQLQTYLDQASQFEQAAIDTARNLLGLGIEVTEVMDMATAAMVAASTALRDEMTAWSDAPWWQTGDIPGLGQIPVPPRPSPTPQDPDDVFNDPGLPLPGKIMGPLIPRQSAEVTSAGQPIVINAQPGVDVAQLTAAVIRELNRQTSLRSLVS